MADGGEDGAAAATGSISIPIIPVDDPPTLDINAGLTVDEGTTASITTAELTASDPDTAPADLIYTVTVSPVNGQLELTTGPGTPITSFTQDDLNNGRVIYVHDGSETISDSFDFALADATTTLATDTFAITVIPVNDAPSLTVTDPAAILEGGSTTIDNTILAGTDPDDAATDITYTVSNVTNGQLELTSGPGVAVTTFTQDDVDNGLVIFVHDGSETLIATFDVSLADGGEDGAAAATGSISIPIIPVNDPAEITTNVEAPLPVGTTLTFDSTILEGTDPDNAPVDLVYTVSNITNGTLTINGVVAVNGSTFTQADINNGLVEFTHDGSLTLTSTFDVSLDDDPLDGNPPDVETVSIDILHPPVLDVNTGTTVLEATPDNPSVNTITTAELSVSDFDSPLTGVTFNVTTSPVNGQLELTTAPGVAITSFTQDDLDNGRVIYVHDGSETISDSFDFEVTDGYFTLPVESFDITVIPQNDKPQITTNESPSIAVGESVVFDNTMLEGTDPDDADTDITYTVSNITNGTLTINGVVAADGSTFTQADINNGLVEFTHDGSMTITGSFDVSLADGGEDGATPDLGTVVVDIEFVPVLDTNSGMLILEGTVANPSINPITTAVLSVSDFDTPDSDIVFNIVDLPSRGHLELTTNPGVPVSSFTQDDIANGRILYVHDGSESVTDTFRFEITDGFYTLPITDFNVTIIPQNDAPILTVNRPDPIVEGESIVIDSTVLKGKDSDDVSSQITYTAYNVKYGHLAFVDAPDTAITSFTQQDVNMGRIIFVHDGSELSFSSFEVRLEDGREDGAAPAFGKVRIDVIPVDDAPVIETNKGATVDEGDSVAIRTWLLDSSDPDTPDSSLIYKINTQPENGQLELTTKPGKAITTFTQADLNAGRVIYVHDGSETTADSFRFTLSDATTTLAMDTFKIKVNPVNDAPELIWLDNTSFIENTAVGTMISGWHVIDPDGPFAHMQIMGDPGIFGINENGIFVTKAMDFEIASQRSWDITLRAFDGEFFIDQTFTFTLGDMNEFPPLQAPVRSGIEVQGMDLRDLNSLRPIEYTFDNMGNLSQMDGSIISSIGFNGLDKLDNAFYGDDMSQIIKHDIVDEISTMFGDGVDFEFEEEVKLFGGEDAANNLSVEKQTGDEMKYPPKAEKSKLLQALMGGQEDAPKQKADARLLQEASPYVQNTEVQLNDAALYYKHKQSKLESVLLNKPNDNN